MSITSRCTECSATSVNGVLTHATKCSGVKPLTVTLESRMPATEITFGSVAEREGFLNQLTQGNGLAASDRNANTDAANPPKSTPPNTGDTDIDKLIKRIMVDCIDTDGVTEQNLLHFTNYGLDFKEAKAAIAKKQTELVIAELEKLKRDTLMPETVNGKFIHEPVTEFARQLTQWIDERIAALQAEETS